DTFRRSASASASSIWNPDSGPRLLEYGSALGWAQTASEPRWPMASSERGNASVMLDPSSSAAPPSRPTRMMRAKVMSAIRKTCFLLLKAPDVGQDRVDLAFGKRFPER